MQERRTRIRVPHRTRAQYCSCDDLLPKEGFLTTLSERGAGLLLREAHPVGEQLTANFSLAGEHEGVTATGVVRWSDTRSRRGPGVQVGLEWLPIEEAASRRLNRFLHQAAQSSSAADSIPRQASVRPVAPNAALVAGIVLTGLLVGGLVGVFWAWPYDPQRAKLTSALKKRDALIEALERQSTQLKRELATTTSRLEFTSAEVAQLGEQAQALEGKAQQFGQEFIRLQDSSVALRQEREALISRILELEQERLTITQRSVPLGELHLAIRETIARRHDAFGAPRIVPARGMTRAGLGNRGYLTRKGRPAVSRSPVSIRVREPELR